MQPTPAHKAYLSQNYFPLLDGLRALAIIGVVWFHANIGVFRPGLISRGAAGVPLFFVISGFLITTLLLREQSNTGAISLRRFYLRRGLRIFPLYYGVLALYVALVFVTDKHSTLGREFWGHLPYFLTYTSNWFVPRSSSRVIFFFAWSLATEEQFYFLWPWVVRASKRPVAPIATMLGVLVLNLAGLLGVAHGALAPAWLPTRILLQLSPAICLGAIAAVVAHQPAGFRWLERLFAWRWSAAAALAATLAALAFDLTADLVADLAMAWLVVACVLRPERQPLAPLLRQPLVRHVGVVSYGVYLLHMLSINLVRGVLHTPNGPLLFVLALPASVVAATLSYRFYETPFLRLKDRLGKPLRIPPSLQARIGLVVARSQRRRLGAALAAIRRAA
jgi:peptidoglycan/LPS O-acetylase OafA/YrhL